MHPVNLNNLENQHTITVSPCSESSRTRRQFLQTSASLISGLLLSSCGWRLANVQSASTIASDTNVLYIFTWAGYTDNDLLDRFTKETGIRVVADVFDSNEAMLARVQAGGGGAYSIIYPSDYMVIQMRELGLLAELDHSRLLNLKDLRSKFKNPVYDPGNRYSTPLSWGTTGLIYNQKKVGKAPENWDYLWLNKDKLLRRMTLLNDVREVMGAVLRMLGYSLNSTNLEEVKKAYDKLAELKPALASFTTDGWRPQMLTGDLKVAMCYSSDAKEVIEENEDLNYIVPSSGSSLWIDTLVIPKTAPNVDAAYQWINFMLQPEIGAEVCQRLNFAPPSEAAFKLLPPAIAENEILFPKEEVLAKCEGIAPVGDFSEVYDRFWTKLTSG